MNWQQEEDKFRALLTEGYRWQLRAAKRLASDGLAVRVPSLQFRDTYKDAEKWKDDHDITVGTKNKLWLEVKARHLWFRKPTDTPTPLSLVTVSSWKKLEDKPFGILLISKKTEEIIFAPTKFEDQWQVCDVYDKTRGFVEHWLSCDHSCLFTYTDLVRVLKVRTHNERNN